MATRRLRAVQLRGIRPITEAVHDREKIIELNDQLRTTFKGGQVRVIPTGYELDAQLCGQALCVMSRSTKFDRDRDHDRGRFVFAGYLFEWRVEYRSRDGTGVSRDPANTDKTCRVLTLCAVDDLLIRTFACGTGGHP